MAFIHDATDSEAELLRELFGPTVVSVMFYDYDFPDEQEANWEQAVATLADGSEVSLDPRHPRWHEIEDLCSERGETVKFGLDLPVSDGEAPEAAATIMELVRAYGDARENGRDSADAYAAVEDAIAPRPVSRQFAADEIETLLHTAAELHLDIEPDDLSELQTTLLDRLAIAWRKELGDDEEPPA